MKKVSEARKKAQALFIVPRAPMTWIEVVYPQRFPIGRGIMAIVIPRKILEDRPISIKRLRHVLSNWPSSEGLSTVDWNGTSCLRYLWRLPHLRAEQRADLVREARKVADFVKTELGVEVRVCPVSTLTQAHQQLDARH